MIYLKNIVHFLLQQIGFNSISDILQNTIAWKHKISTVYLFAFSFGGVLSTLESLTEQYIYTPALGVLILWLTTLFDTLLGVSTAIHLKKGINPNRLGAAAIRLVVQTLIVALFYQMSHVWSIFINNWMVDSLLIIFTLSTFYSVLQNANKLNLITNEQYIFIESLVNLKELLTKFKKK